MLRAKELVVKWSKVAVRSSMFFSRSGARPGVAPVLTDYLVVTSWLTSLQDIDHGCLQAFPANKQGRPWRLTES